MENTWILYCFKFTVALAFFYALYRLFLKGDTFFALRRYYFLFTLLFSTIFPWIRFELPLQTAHETILPLYWLSQVEITAPVETVKEKAFDPALLLFLLAAGVSIYLLLGLSKQVYQIIKLKSSHPQIKTEQALIIQLKGDNCSPFSFFHWVFINERNSVDREAILLHEMVHVRQWHSADVLLSSLICAVCWWNPFAWLIRKEIRENLEYLADEGVLQTGCDSKGYQYALLKTLKNNGEGQLINNFNVSQLKKRIEMMNKRKSKWVISVKYLLILPAACCLLLANAAQTAPELIRQVSGEKPNKSTGQAITNNEEDQPSFPGGKEALQAFIAKTLKYPVDGYENGIQGRVTVRFTVTKTGEISQPTVVRGLGVSFDKEALRVVNTMPKWIPAKRNGQAVDATYELPLSWVLERSNPLNNLPELLVLNGKIASQAEYEQAKAAYLQKEKKGTVKQPIVELVLEEADAVKKYGDKAKGKKVVEVKIPQ